MKATLHKAAIRRFTSALSRKTAVLAATATALSVQQAYATNYIWDGAGANTNWSTAGNWSGSTPSTINSNTFNFGPLSGASNTTSNIDLTGNPGPFVFNSTLTSAMTLTGNALQFGAATTSGAVVTNSSTSLQTIQNAVSIFNGVSFQATSGNLAFTNATLTFRSDLTSSFSLILDGAANGSISGNITAGAAGAQGITKQGLGTWTLGGTASTYTGTTSITAGTLSVSANNALGANAAPVSINGGTLATTGAVLTNTHAVTIGASGGTMSIGPNQFYFHTANTLLGSGALTITGGDVRSDTAQTYSGAITLQTGGSFEFNTGAGVSAVASAATFAVNGPGTGVQSTSGELISTSGVTTLSNSVSVNGGILSFDNGSAGSFSGPITVGASGAVIGLRDWYALSTATSGTISGIVSGTAGGLTVNNGSAASGGVLTLSNTNTYNGPTTINSGTVSVSADANLGTAPGSPTTGKIVLNGGILSASTGFTLNANRGIALGPATGTGSGTLDVASGQTLTYAGIIANNGGTGNLIKTSAGTLNLSTTNTYTGSTTITGGTISVAADANLGTAPASVTAGDLVLNGGTLSARTGFTLNANRGIALGPTSGSGTGTIDVASGQTLSYAGTIANNGGTGALTKTSGGTLALSTANTYSGGTTINDTGGILAVSNAGALGTGAVTIGSGGGNLVTGEIQLSNNIAITSVPTFNFPQSRTFTTGGGNADLENLSGANSLSANFNINGGGGNGANILSTAGTLTLSGTLKNTVASSNRGFDFYGAGNGIVSGSIVNTSGTSTTLVQKDGTGAWTFSGTNSYTGSTTINAGNLTISAVTALSSGSATTVVSGAQLNITAAGTYSAPLTLNGSNGVANLDPANNAGALRFNKDGGAFIYNAAITEGTSAEIASFGIGGSATLSGGITGGTTSTTLTLAAGSNIVSNGYTYILSGTNTYLGNTTLLGRAASPTLQLGVANALPTTTTLTIQGGNGGSAILDLNGFSQQLAGLTTAAPIDSGSATNRVITSSATASQVLTISNNTTASSYSGFLGGTGTNNNNFGLTKSGTATFTLNNSSASSNTYTGPTLIQQGELVAASTVGLPLSTSAITVSSGAGLTVQDHGGGVPNMTNSLTLAGSGVSGNGALNFFNSGNFSLTGAINLTAATTIRTDPFGQSNPIAFTNAISGTGGLTFFSQASNAGGAPRFTLSGASTYSGNTVITSSGTSTAPFALTLTGGANRLPVGTSLVFGGNPTSATGTFNSNVNLELDGISQTLAGISVASGASGAYSVIGVNSTPATLTIANTTPDTFAGTLGGAGTNNNNLGLIVSGSSTLALTGTNTYTGGTTLNGGTTQINSAASLGATSGSVTINAATLETTANISSSRSVVLGDVASSIKVDPSTTYTLSSPVTGTGTLNLTGTGTLDLTAANTYSGNTNVNAGTLTVDTTGSIASTNVAVAASATMNVLAGGSISSSTNLTNNGTVNLNNPTRTIATLNGSGALNLNSTALTVSNGGSYSGVIANGASAGSLTLSGGSLTLSGASTYSGGTTVSAGTLLATNTSGSATGSAAVTIASGATLGGTGILSGPVTVNGTIFAGLTNNTAGKTAAVLNIGSGSTLAGSTLLDLTATNASDEITFNGGAGLANLGGTLTVTNPNSISFAVGQTYDLFGFGSEAGTFSSSPTLPSLPSTLAWNTSQLYSNGIISIGSNGPIVSQWAASIGGSWNTSSNWSNGIPTGQGAQANMLSAPGLTAPASVTLDGNQTIGRLTFNNSSAYSIDQGTGSGTLTLDDTNGISGVNPSITVSSGNHAITAPISLAAGVSISTAASSALNISGNIAGTGNLTASGSGTVTLAGANTYSGNTTVNAGTMNLTGSITSANVTVASGATLNASGATNNGLASSANVIANGTVAFAGAPLVAGPNPITVAAINVGSLGQVNVTDPGTATGNHANRTVLLTSSLSLPGTTDSWSGQVDLAGNDLIVHGGSVSDITNQIKSGYNNGSFNGSGITSTAALNDPNTLSTLGVLLNNDGSGNTLYDSFDNQSVTAADVLVKYTYYGDANLDGTVNSSDYSQIDNGFNSNLSGWYNGDFNYDGVVNSSDYSLIDNAFNQTQGTSLSSASAAGLMASSTALIAPASSAAVPEPSSLCLLGLAAAGLMGRRRRRQMSVTSK